MELRRPSLEDKDAVMSLIMEFESSNTAHDGGFWDKENFVYEDWIAGNQDAEIGLNIPDTWVPAIQLVGFDKGQAVGFLNLRLRLNEHLREHGGHIGYSVRPSMQGKGYATAMLKEGLLVAASKNIHRVLVTCSVENPASRAVILKNGGILEDIRQDTERYWIDLN
ncbi:ribosomal-protein-L7/L12-serine acetyltransferase [Streptococcus constellatus]|uniref:Ribosomal-protein-L7/L12-serine acetyltransferase n=1 Tax=Streptococcus constellatus TaxID=76860 RepID=A0A564T2A5_STRCV|nr:GNAT family N-acetyltransferase [Streptococcus constellatus]VUX01219.1 ribosomal-protein-L7/L12-serine acetyltransferase [Streptococcus constellatus]VUX03422.1 ribosomal-protein-L7/L12-serine acetyltransferase [Streptococcus gordonii]